MTDATDAGGRLRYSDDDRIFALRWLAIRRGNVSQTARELGCPISSLWQWATAARVPWLPRLSATRPLTGLRVFRGRCLPIILCGQPVTVDVARLTGEEFTTFAELVDKMRVEPEVGGR